MSERPRILVVGVGSIGERHLRCFGRVGGLELALCETKAELRTRVTQQYSIAHSFENLDEAVARFHPTAAVIATPAPTHIPLAIQLARQGLHLLIEKPLAISLDGVAELQQLARQNQLTVGVAYVYRAHPALQAMCRAIAEGRFGTPVELVAVGGQYFPTFRPAYRDTYYVNRALGGGAIQDALTHIINAGEWLTGPIEAVVGDALHQVLEGVDVEDTVHVLARHRSPLTTKPVMASYCLNQHQSPNEVSITVIGTKGTARFEMHASRWRWMVESASQWHDEPAEIPDRDTLFMRQAQAFVAAVREGTPPLCSLDEGVQTLRVNRAILDSVMHPSWRML